MEPYWLFTRTWDGQAWSYSLYFVDSRDQHMVFLMEPSIDDLTTKMAKRSCGPCLEDEVRTLAQSRVDVAGREEGVTNEMMATMRQGYEQKVRTLRDDFLQKRRSSYRT